MQNNIILTVDSYKASHFLQLPPNTTHVYSYIESRGGAWDRTVFFGLQAFIKEYLTRPITVEMIDEAEAMLMSHGEPFNREGWEYILREHDGYLPVLIKAVPEGLIIPNKNVLATIVNTDPKCFWLPSYLETALLRAIWFPTTVATQSFEAKQVIMRALLETSDDPDGQIPFKLHDFGARGVSSSESAMLGGLAHLVNFMGTDTVEALVAAKRWYGATTAVGYSIPACYDSETEILTGRGFVRFSDLIEGEKVAEYRDDGSVSFVAPTKIVNESYEGEMIRFFTDGQIAKIDTMVTPNHRMVRRAVSSGKIEIFEAKDVKFSQRNIIPMAGDLVGDAKLDDIERLRIAFQADGSFVASSRAFSYTGGRTGTIPIRFSLKKERKQKRLEALLTRLGVAFTKSTTASKPGFISYWCPIPLNWQFSKTFDWVDLENKSAQWARDFIAEAAEWDGKRVANSVCYSSTDEFNADVVQSVAVVGGMRASKSVSVKRENRRDLYNVVASDTNSRVGKRVRKEITHYSGSIHCVTVPSGMIIIRRNGCVMVCGNSEHSTITSWGRESEVDAFRNMLRQFAKPGALVAVVSDSYDLWNAIDNIWGQELRQEVIDSGATVIVRPDSGDPRTVPVEAVRRLGEKFGYTVNSKGFKVLNHVRVIQGDGIAIDTIRDILDGLKAHGWSADNIAFGMGGGLLQQVNRDTLKFAMKCSAVCVDGEWRDVFKAPVTDLGKASKKGRFALTCENGRFETVSEEGNAWRDFMVPVFRNGKLLREWTLDEVRARAK